MGRTLTIEDLHRLRTAGDPQVAPDGSAVAFTVTAAASELDRMVTQVWVVRPGGAPPAPWTRRPDGAWHPRWSPDGRELAFLSAGRSGSPQLQLLGTEGGEARQVTDLPGGVTEFAWSPDGTRLAVVAAVEPERGEEGAAGDARPLEVRRLGYKADGAGFLGERRTHLFLVERRGGEPRQLTGGDQFAAAPAWSPDGTAIAFTAAAHDERDLDGARHLFTVPAAGGEALRVVGGGWVVARALWLDAGRLALVGLPRSTEVQATLYTVAAGGGEPEPLLGEFDRTVMVGAPAYPGGFPALIDGGAAVAFCARIGGCTHLFSKRLDGTAPPEPLLAGPDRVVQGLGVAGALAAVAVADPGSPGDVHLVDLGTRAASRLTDLNAGLRAGAEVALPTARWFTAPDGTRVEGYLWGAGPGGPRPLLLNVHGGPHNAWTPALSGFELHQQELVARGWCVLALNPRGSDGYGADHQRAVRGGWGEHDEQDFLGAVETLIAEGVADPERVAVTGYSYGGFMTAWLAGRSDRFAAAVAGGSVTNLASEYGTSDLGGHLGEAEVGAEPWEDPELYARLSPLTYAPRVRAPLLILHGERDDRCGLGQAEELFTRLRRLRREVEMVVYPGASHLFVVAGRPSHQVDYQRRLVDWVTRHAVPAAAAEPAERATASATT